MSVKRRFSICELYPCGARSLLAVVLVALLAACSGGSGDAGSQPTGSLSFRVQWDRSAVPRGQAARAGVGDCSDVDTVAAAVYDANGGLLQTGGPWNCTDGQGIVSQVPAERYVQVAVVGLTTGGLARYRGQSSGFFYLPAGPTFDAGLITAPAFTATLTSPADGATVPVSGLTLAWDAVTGADSYVVEIADDIGFGSAVFQTLTVDSSAGPSCQPDTSALRVDLPYFWRVQVVDGAGNTSEPSGALRFFISNQLPTARIIAPAGGYIHTLNTPLTCQGQGTDPEDGALTGTALQWQLLDIDGQLLWSGSGAAPVIDATHFTNSGTYTITLQVTDANGGTGSASVDFDVISV
jgi:hypothetical protein